MLGFFCASSILESYKHKREELFIGQAKWVLFVDVLCTVEETKSLWGQKCWELRCQEHQSA